MKTHTKIRQLIYTTLGILCVCLLFLGATMFPKIYYRFYDNNSFHQITHTNVQLRTYKTSYNSFEEKLHALAQGINLRAVPIRNPNIEKDREKLTEIANQQLKTMKSYYILDDTITLKEKNLTSFERYTIYSSNNMQSFCCWKLIYTMSKREITLYIDEEFHKIYFLRIENTKLKKANSNTSYAAANDFYMSQKIRQKMFLRWWNGMLQYYNLNINALNYSLEEINLCGVIQFNDASLITLYDQWDYDKNGNVNRSIGIPIKKLIQF